MLHSCLHKSPYNKAELGYRKDSVGVGEAAVR